MSFVLFKHFVPCVPVRLSLLSEVRYFRVLSELYGTYRLIILCAFKQALRISPEIRHRYLKAYL